MFNAEVRKNQEKSLFCREEKTTSELSDIFHECLATAHCVRINICGIHFHYQSIFYWWERVTYKILKILFKGFDSFKMKLILLTAFVIKFTVEANEQYSFAPQFHKPSQGSYGSESSIFLPPESHTPIPYYPVKSQNNLPFPYLPPTGTKAPSVYPSPFPVILSSTLIPIFDDDDDEKEDKKRNNNNISSPSPHINNQKQNISENTARVQHAMRREMRANPKMGNYHNPIDRIDMRFQQQFATAQTQLNPGNQTPRNLIIDTHRNDIFDQIRSPSSQNPHYVAAHGFTISSTTEPAIPIIRLSNEMDLDGSFSYEALGADQTHYVQHSHMENLGSDKQEQVVEGSYSYVGDNGQTYTVNYIADSNGFRASGDHLPVAPPIPEIIQRAIQYNLAEEAKKPPHLRGWHDDEKDFDSNERGQQFAAPPPRNLFTGRTPEAFSHSFSQGTNSENNLAAASSSQIPVKSNPEYIIDQTRPKNNNQINNQIAPQITFLASQGAHVPSMNQQSAQQSISRIFYNDKSTMPQLINYDAGNKEAELEGNKALWRWQYGLNSNNFSQTPEKNTISRSFGEGDDIMINFSDMTPEQYTRMLHSEIGSNNKDSGTSAVYSNNNNQYHRNDIKNSSHMTKTENSEQSYQTSNYFFPSVNNVKTPQAESLPTSTTVSYANNSPLYYSNKDSSNFMSESYSTISTYGNFGSQSQSYTNQNEYNDIPYESKRTRALHVDSDTKSNIQNMNTIPVSNNASKVSFDYWSSIKIPDTEPHTITQVPTFYTSTNIPTFSNFYEEKMDFKPIHKPFQETRETTTVTPQTTTENIFKTNIFLKSINTNLKKSDSSNIDKGNEGEQTKTTHNKPVDDSKHIMQIPNKFSAETRTETADKYPKFNSYSKTVNDVKYLKAKPFELSDVINYITNKNLFESSKLKPKINNVNYDNYGQNNEMRYDMYQQEKNEDGSDKVIQRPHIFPRFNREERDELRGIVKNYKVLQRNNNAKNLESNSFHIRKDMTQPSIRTLQSSGLPPLGRAGPSMKTYIPPIYA
ncbi:unnamed protein product [Chilo suppressalis]|uniref:Uncharacterized protein n=1 Tax=Chilo suppressalis TaxID=168631 RepID=A0ABN8ECA7_CHISP|nr:unnamed protein product [Chilo suppressalis]